MPSPPSGQNQDKISAYRTILSFNSQAELDKKRTELESRGYETQKGHGSLIRFKFNIWSDVKTEIKYGLYKFLSNYHKLFPSLIADYSEKRFKYSFLREAKYRVYVLKIGDASRKDEFIQVDKQPKKTHIQVNQQHEKQSHQEAALHPEQPTATAAAAVAISILKHPTDPDKTNTPIVSLESWETRPAPTETQPETPKIPDEKPKEVFNLTKDNTDELDQAIAEGRDVLFEPKGAYSKDELLSFITKHGGQITHLKFGANENDVLYNINEILDKCNNLKKLELYNCFNIQIISPSIEHEHLTSIIIKDCDIRNIDLKGFKNLTNFQFDAFYLDNGLTLHGLEEIHNLKSLILNVKILNSIDPSSHTKLEEFKIKTLDKEIFNKISNLSILKTIGINFYDEIKDKTLIEIDLTKINDLQELEIENCKFVSKINLSSQNKLEILNLSKCSNLSLVEIGKTDSLKELFINECENLESLGNLTEIPNLTSIRLLNCYKLKEIPNITQSKDLSYLQMDFDHSSNELILLQLLYQMKDVPQILKELLQRNSPKTAEKFDFAKLIIDKFGHDINELEKIYSLIENGITIEQIYNVIIKHSKIEIPSEVTTQINDLSKLKNDLTSKIDQLNQRINNLKNNEKIEKITTNIKTLKQQRDQEITLDKAKITKQIESLQNEKSETKPEIDELFKTRSNLKKSITNKYATELTNLNTELTNLKIEQASAQNRKGIADITKEKEQLNEQLVNIKKQLAEIEKKLPQTENDRLKQTVSVLTELAKLNENIRNEILDWFKPDKKNNPQLWDKLRIKISKKIGRVANQPCLIHIPLLLQIIPKAAEPTAEKNIDKDILNNYIQILPNLVDFKAINALTKLLVKINLMIINNKLTPEQLESIKKYLSLIPTDTDKNQFRFDHWKLLKNALDAKMVDEIHDICTKFEGLEIFEKINEMYISKYEQLYTFPPDFNFKEKYENTIEKFRDPTALIIYKIDLWRTKKSRRDFNTQIQPFLNRTAKEILDGTLQKNRYENNLHLSKVFSGKQDLKDAWREGEKFDDLNDLKLKAEARLGTKLGNIAGLTVMDTDNPEDMLLMGEEVQSCLAISTDKDEGTNKCLLAYLLDGKNRLIAVKDKNGKIIGRCILRILDDGKGNPVLFREKLYVPSKDDTINAFLEEAVLQRAIKLNLPLLKKDFSNQKNEQISDPTAEFPALISHGRVEPEAKNKNEFFQFEYVDGLVTDEAETKEFGRFQIVNPIVVYNPKEIKV